MQKARLEKLRKKHANKYGPAEDDLTAQFNNLSTQDQDSPAAAEANQGENQSPPAS